jgi:DNA-binding transcriptional regulator YiaG
MAEMSTFTFTSTELETVIEAAVEKAVSRMQIKTPLIEEKRGKKKFLKIKEFAQEFNVTPAAVHKWVMDRKIYAEKLNGTRIWRIPIEEIEKFKSRSKKTTNKDIFNRSF